MATGKKILLQTTIPYEADDWHVGRFSLLRSELSKENDVVARNREAAGSGDDPVLSGLGDSDFDELWLMAVDLGGGLSENDVRGILAFRQRGGGMLTARDHMDLGSSLCTIGSLGKINHFHTRNPEPDATRHVNDDLDNPAIGYPNYHSGANGNYQKIDVVGTPHEVLRSDRSPGGIVSHFPAHPHEGAIGVPDDAPYAKVIATGKSIVTGRPFNLVIAIDGEPGLGRGIALASFHHLVDLNWDTACGAPSFVGDKPGTEIKENPAPLAAFKDYVRNVARWLSRN